MHSILAEALKKMDEFPTKALVKLVDSVFVMAPTEDFAKVEAVVKNRMNEVVDLFISTWSSPESVGKVEVEKYIQQVKNLGFSECGYDGTTKVLTGLGIPMPSKDFIHQCHKRLEATWQERQRKQDCGCVVAEVALTVLERAVSYWVVRWSGDPLPVEAEVLPRPSDSSS